MRGDGAHTHHGHNSPGGLGLAVSIGAGLVLASVIETILPVLLIVLAVVAGLLVLGLISHAVTTLYSYNEVIIPGSAAYPPLPAADNDQTQMPAMPSTSAGLPAQHQHLHFHGLDPAEVAAILAAHRGHAADRDGEPW